jgi:hypothetical protein
MGAAAADSLARTSLDGEPDVDIARKKRVKVEKG